MQQPSPRIAIANPGASPAARIAIVAESEPVGDSLHMLLESHRYTVERLSFPKDVPAGFAQDFDCLLIGQFQPGHRGLALLAALQAQGMDTGAALITNMLNEADARSIAALRNVTVFEKPMSPDAILAFVAQTAGRGPVDRCAAPKHG